MKNISYLEYLVPETGKQFNQFLCCSVIHIQNLSFAYSLSLKFTHEFDEPTKF